MKKILILSNHHSYTYNLRKEIIQELISNGYKVTLVLPYGEKVDKLKKMGCDFIDLPLDRRGINPVNDLKLLLSYIKIMKKIKPDLVMSYAIKHNIYGGISTRILKIPFLPNVTGLGSAVKRKGLFQKIMTILHRIAFKNANCVFFQNKANKDFFVANQLVKENFKIIPGSGINLEEFSLTEYPKEKDELNILFIGRIMKDKGIEELIKAAQILNEQNIKVNFDAIGFYEGEYAKRVKELDQSNLITFHGSTNDVKDFIKKSHAVILPSHHEGMANVLLEAAAMGRPILGSLIPGCQETFKEGVTGYGFEPGNVDSLLQAIYRFLKLSYEQKIEMGKQGRKKIVLEFDRQEIVSEYVKIIKNIL